MHNSNVIYLSELVNIIGFQVKTFKTGKIQKIR